MLLSSGAAEDRSGLRRWKYRTHGQDCGDGSCWWESCYWVRVLHWCCSSSPFSQQLAVWRNESASSMQIAISWLQPLQLLDWNVKRLWRMLQKRLVSYTSSCSSLLGLLSNSKSHSFDVLSDWVAVVDGCSVIPKALMPREVWSKLLQILQSSIPVLESIASLNSVFRYDRL